MLLCFEWHKILYLKNAFVCFHLILNWLKRIKFLIPMSGHLVWQILKAWWWRTVKLNTFLQCIHGSKRIFNAMLMMHNNQFWWLPMPLNIKFWYISKIYMVKLKKTLILNRLVISDYCFAQDHNGSCAVWLPLHLS